MFSPSKCQRLEPTTEIYTDKSKFNVDNLSYTNELTATEPSTHVIYDDEEISFPDSCCKSANDMMNKNLISLSNFIK